MEDEESLKEATDFSSRPPTTQISMSRSVEDSEDSIVFRRSPTKQWADYAPNTKSVPNFLKHQSSIQDEGSFTVDFEKEDGPLGPTRSERPTYARADQRTIVAKNLSERATHRDIVNFVRGGLVLDIYLRSSERNASISFVEGSAAQNFMNYVKRHDVYLHGKRVRPWITPPTDIVVDVFKRLSSAGMTGNSYYPGTLPTKSASVLRATL